jgi:NAD+ kinase
VASTSTVGQVPRNTIGVVLHPSRPVVGSLQKITTWAAEHDVEVLMREVDAERLLAPAAPVSDEEFRDRVESVISLGGDGTMLGALRLVGDRPVPVMGVNHGHLGFLVELEPDELDGALDRLVRGDYVIEPQSCLTLTVDPDPDPEVAEMPTLRAFNDVVLTRRGQSHSVSLDLVVNGDRYGYYRCDAVIVSTPAGSTAYNYAAGGPIVSPSAAATVITPVAPMSGIARPVVLGAGELLRLEVPHEAPKASIELDGVPVGTLRQHRGISVQLVPDAGLVVRFDGTRHFERNRVKLSLLDLPLRRDQLLDLVPAELRERVTGTGHPPSG